MSAKKLKIGRKIKEDIVIKASANMSYIVKVGCAELAFSNEADLLEALRAYLDDPKKYDEEYNKLQPSDQENTIVTRWRLGTPQDEE